MIHPGILPRDLDQRPTEPTQRMVLLNWKQIPRIHRPRELPAHPPKPANLST